jgi:hypothetical protein
MDLSVSAVLITREAEYPKDVRLDFPFEEVIIETQCTGVRRRFELAQQARNEVIYVQDDDCSLDIRRLWSHYDGRLTHAITPGHKIMYAGLGVTLIGWGCFFPKRLIDWSRWDRMYGAGTIPEVEYDRVFTYLAQPHNTVVMPFHQIPRPRAMSRDNPDHYTSRARIFEALRLMKETEDRQ